MAKDRQSGAATHDGEALRALARRAAAYAWGDRFKVELHNGQPPQDIAILVADAVADAIFKALETEPAR